MLHLPKPPPMPVRIMPEPEPASARRWRILTRLVVIVTLFMLAAFLYGCWHWWW